MMETTVVGSFPVSINNASDSKFAFDEISTGK